MLTAKQFEGLKKTNLSVDTAKSKDRISSDFKALSNEMKRDIIALSGLSRATFYNAFQSGSASPKIVLAIAQSIGVSPYYYTGEADEKGSFDSKILNAFLKDKKLNAPVKKAGAKRGRKPAAVKAAKPAKSAKPAPVKAAKPAKTAPVKAAKPAKPAVKAEKAPAQKSAPPAKKPMEVVMQIGIPKSPKLQKAVSNLDEESAVLLLRALIRKADANDNAKALCDVIKSCLLS
jgi:hypothetical protein